MDRLDAVIALNANISRSAAAALIKDGAVTVDGCTVRDASRRFDYTAEFTLRGAPLRVAEHVYIMMNKPAGVVSASEGGTDVTVVDILPRAFARRGLFPAGRLDRDTTGFCLITDDGGFAHRILSPVSHVPKTYRARIDCPAGDGFGEAFARGIVLRDGTALLPAGYRLLSQGENALCEVVITQGVYHQVKLMFASLGCKVIQLERTAMGGLELDKALAPGECRYINNDELVKITNPQL